jgi:hypothetical protein
MIVMHCSRESMMMNPMLSSGTMKEEDDMPRGDSFRGVIDEVQQTIFESFASLDDNNLEECFGLDIETAAAAEQAEAAGATMADEPSTPTTPSPPCESPPPQSVTSTSSMDADKPKRPLSAYNLFFQLERERLIAGTSDTDFTAADVERVAIARRLADMQSEKPKRKHRKSHGKITFAELARTIANKWKVLTPHAKDLLRELEEWTKKSETERKERAQSESPLESRQFIEPAVIVTPRPIDEVNISTTNPSQAYMSGMSSMFLDIFKTMTF